jgi:hypothetical protein
MRFASAAPRSGMTPELAAGFVLEREIPHHQHADAQLAGGREQFRGLHLIRRRLRMQ